MSIKEQNQEFLTFNKLEILESPFLLDQYAISPKNVGLPHYMEVEGELTINPLPNTKIYRIFKISRRTKGLIVEIEKGQKILKITSDSFIIMKNKGIKINADLNNNLNQRIDELIKVFAKTNDLLNEFFNEIKKKSQKT